MLYETLELLKAKYLLEEVCKLKLAKSEYICVRINVAHEIIQTTISHYNLLSFVGKTIKEHKDDALLIDGTLVHKGKVDESYLDFIKRN